MSPRGKVFRGRCTELNALHSRIAVCSLCKNRSQAAFALLTITAAVFCSSKLRADLKEFNLTKQSFNGYA